MKRHNSVSVSSLLLSVTFALVVQADSRLPGISGLAHLDGSLYVAVHDTKANEANTVVNKWISLVDLLAIDKPSLKPLAVDWSILGDELPNDLESICPLPGQDKQYLIVESSHGAGKFGRIIHVDVLRSVDGLWSAKALHCQQFPQEVPNTDEELDNIEGCVAFTSESGTCLVLGKRGKNKNDAILLWGRYDSDASNFRPIDLARFATPFRDKEVPKDKRYCSDLLLDGTRLLAVSCNDPGADGPFDSAIYVIGEVAKSGDGVVNISVASEATAEIEEHKVEALALSPNGRDGIIVGCDDEKAGGGLLHAERIVH